MTGRIDGNTRTDADKRAQDLERRIAELKSRWPAHSVPPAMLQELDDLEEELEQLRANIEGRG